MRRRAQAAATTLFFAAASNLSAGSALAQPADAMERARRAFAEGAEAENQGDCIAALEHFEEVVAVKETPAVRLRIGRCHEKLGKLVAALRDYERAKELAQSEPQALEVATKVSADLAGRIPRVKVRVLSPDGTVVKVDGAELPSSVTSTPVDPGRHRVTATASGYEPFEESFDLSESNSRSLTITLRALREPLERPAPTPLDESEESVVPWLPIALYGGGAVALGVGIPLLITSISDDAALDEKCFDEKGKVSADRDPCLKKDGSGYTTGEQAEIGSERDSINTRQIVGWTLIGVGAATAGVATLLLVTADNGDSEEDIAAAPVVAPGYVGWAMSGRF